MMFDQFVVAPPFSSSRCW